METRRATNEEIFQHYGRFRRATFRHFIRVIHNPRAVNGVSHRQHSAAKLHNIDGVPHVQHHGEKRVVTANFYTLPSGTTFVGSLRLDNPYLP